MSVSLNVNTSEIIKAVKSLDDLTRASEKTGAGFNIVINQSVKLGGNLKTVGGAVNAMASEFERLMNRMNPIRQTMGGLRQDLQTLKEGYKQGRVSASEYKDMAKRLLEQMKALRNGTADAAAEQARAAAEAQRYAAAMGKLLAAANPLDSRMDKIRESMKQLQEAQKQGVITSEQLKRALSGYGAQLNALNQKQGGAGKSYFERSLERVRNQIDPTRAKLAELRASIEVLKQGFAIGKVGTEEYRASLKSLLEQMKAVRTGQNTDGGLNRYSDSIQRLLAQANPLKAQIDAIKLKMQQLSEAAKTGAVTHNQLREAQRGYIDQIRALRAASGAGADSMTKYNELAKKLGITVGQASMAMRGLPMQMNDIVVSLAGGMPPLMVFMQQLPQIRDQFGSWRGAVEGVKVGMQSLGRSMLALAATPTGPILAIVAAVGSVGLLAESAARDVVELNRVLALTGGYGATSALEISNMAEAMSKKLGVSISEAKDSILSLAQSGKVPQAQMEMVANAVIGIRKAFNEATSQKVAEGFQAIFSRGKSGVEELQRQYHFLTSAQMENYVQMLKNGEVLEANEYAAKAFADSMEDAANRTAASMTPLQRLTKNVGVWFSNMWSGVKIWAYNAINQTIDQFSLMGTQIKMFFTDLNATIFGTIAKTQESFGKAMQYVAEKIPGAQKILGDWSDAGNDMRTRQENELAILAGLKQKENDTLARLNGDYYKSQLAAQQFFHKSTVKQENDFYKKLSEVDKKEKEKKYRQSAGDRVSDQLEKDILALTTQLKVLKEQGKEYKNMSSQRKSYFDLQAKIEVIEDKIRKDANAKLTDEEKSLLLNKERLLSLAKQKAELGDSLKLEEARLDAQIKAEQQIAELRAKAGRGGIYADRARETSQIQTSGEPDEIIQLQLEAARKRYAEEDAMRLDWVAGMKSGAEEVLSDYTDLYSQMASFGQDMFKGLSDSLADFCKTGKLNFADFAKDIISKLIDIMVQASLANAVMSMTGLGSGGVNLFAGIAKGFSGGGYTGDGGKFEPKGVVHGGEFVFSKAATKALGVENLDAIHKKALRGYASGGAVGNPAIRSNSGGGGGGMTNIVASPNITINSGDGGSDKNLERSVEGIFKRMLMRELSQGGELRKALDSSRR